MKTFQLSSIVFLGTALLSLAGEKPNIIVILADDLGYADTQPYGSEIQTPNLMRLAESGLQNEDLIQSANGKAVRSVRDLLRLAKNPPIKLGFVRGQENKEARLTEEESK
jgi:S1-C subfamily serine protease